MFDRFTFQADRRVNSINKVCILVKAVVTELKVDVQGNERKSRESDGESQDIDKCECPLPGQGSEGEDEMGFQHAYR